MNRVEFKTVAVANQGGAMVAETISKNGASPKSHTIRGIFIYCLVVAAIAISALFTSCKKDKKDTAPELVRERYIATPVELKPGEIGIKNHRVDHSVRYTGKYVEKITLNNTPEKIKANTEIENGTYDAYYIYLGKVDMTPISAKVAYQHNGMGPYEYIYSISEITEKSVSESSSTTVSNTIQVTRTYNNVFNIEKTTEIGVEIEKIFTAKANLKLGYSHTWGGSTTTTNQTSKTETYTTIDKWGKQETETAKFTLNEKYPAGWYRLTLFATCDVYVAVICDHDEKKWYYDYSVFAKEGTLGYALDYNTTNDFGIGKDAIKLIFDPSIIDLLSETIPEFSEEYEIELEYRDPERQYIDENGKQQSVPNEIKIEGYFAQTTLGNDGTTTWVRVNGDINTENRIAIKGDVRMILADGCKLDARKGISVTGSGNRLTIYAQSIGENMGSLKATGTSYSAGIGGAAGQSCGEVTINGGTIEAIGANAGSGGNPNQGAGAGIGGGGADDSNGIIGASGGIITINGGEITAKGGNGGNGQDGALLRYGRGGGGAGAGIGGGGGRGATNTTGNNGGNGGAVKMNNGFVTATGGSSGSGGGGRGAGIGGGGGSGGTGDGNAGNGGNSGGNTSDAIGNGATGGKGYYNGGSGGTFSSFSTGNFSETTERNEK